MKAPLLYISYDGMLEPLGQSQVLAYLERLADEREVHLISFEKPADRGGESERAVAERLRAAGIAWHPHRYHKRPSALATAWDILAGTWTGLRLARRHRIGIVHARSDVPAAMALAIKRATGACFLFDMRGFWADERVDGGLWPRDGLLYRIARRCERRFLLGADHVVSLTEAGLRELRRLDFLRGRMPPATVIPTCADLDRFAPAAAPPPGFVLGYVGSAGTWYLFDAVVACFARLRERRPEARLLVVNRGEHAYVRERLRAGGVPDAAVELRAAAHDEVPAQMARMHAGVFFVRPAYSKQASAPTRLAEFLGCGLPCLSNAGVGDMAAVLEGERVGVAVDAFGDDALRRGLDALEALLREPELRARCVRAAHRHFSLETGVARYRAVYAALEAH